MRQILFVLLILPILILCACTSEPQNPTPKPTPTLIPTPASPPILVPSPRPSKTLSIADVVAKVSPAVVRIITDGGSGSGIVIDTAGHVLTNNHVVEKASSATIIFKDGQEIEGRLVSVDTSLDLAILKVNKANLSVAALGDSGQTQLGEEVLALGFPSGLGGSITLTKGIISAFRHPYLQTDAAVNPGSSGGPLVNMYGEIIGIVTFKPRLDEGEPAEGIGFAIAINEVKKKLPDLLSLSSERLYNLSVKPLKTQLSKGEGSGVGYPANIVVDLYNNAHAIWTESYSRTQSDWRIVYSIRSPSGSWSAPYDVSSSFLRGATITVDQIGTAHVVWDPGIYPRGPRYIAYANKPMGGEWTAPVNIFSGPEDFDPFDLVVDSKGTLHLIWVDRIMVDHPPGNNRFLEYSVKYAQKTKSGLWSEPVVIPNVHPSFPYWETNRILAVDSEDTLLLAWLSVDVYLSKKPLGEPWSLPEKVSSISRPGRSANIAIDYRGKIHIAWAEGSSRIVYSSRASDGTWSSSTYVSTTDKPVDNVLIATSNDGEVYVAWTQDTDDKKGASSLMLAKRFQDGSWSTPIVVYEQFEAAPKAIAVNAEGAIHIIAGRGTSSSKDVGIYDVFIPAISKPVE
jgi:S1-C subfamily serine protease